MMKRVDVIYLTYIIRISITLQKSLQMKFILFDFHVKEKYKIVCKTLEVEILE